MILLNAGVRTSAVASLSAAIAEVQLDYLVNVRAISLPVSRSSWTKQQDQEFAITRGPSSRTAVHESCGAPSGGMAVHLTEPSVPRLVMLAA
jgi:hypothetical protein